MKKLMKLFFSVTIIAPAALVVACGTDNRANTLTIFADGENDANALRQIGEDFLEEFGIKNFNIRSQPVDMRSTASLMVSNPRMVRTDLFNMPHDYIGNLHSTRAMTNLNEIELVGNGIENNLSDFGIQLRNGEMISPNGQVMAVEWDQFIENVNEAWDDKNDLTYGIPVSQSVIDDIALYETQSGQRVRFDYIWPSTFQTNMTEINLQMLEDAQRLVSGAAIADDGSFNFDARDLIKAQVSTGTWTSTSESHRHWNTELFFNDFRGDFVTSAFLMELPQIAFENGGGYYEQDDIRILDSSGDPFFNALVELPDGSFGQSSAYIRRQFEQHWIEWFNWLIDEYYSASRSLPDYEANAKILKDEFARGNLFLWNTATWDMAGAAKEFKPNGSLTAGNGRVDLLFGQSINWNKENKANPLMMVGGLGTYQLARHKELSLAFLQYLARRESSYTWMKNSRGMMFDASAFKRVREELMAIVNDDSLTLDQKNALIVEFFNPIEIDRPFIDVEYVEYWIQGMEQAIINADNARIIPSYPSWTSFLGEFASSISALYDATQTNRLDIFREQNVEFWVRQWVRALDPRNLSGWREDYE